MQNRPPLFVIPTYRLRDVGETIHLYDEHFWRNGHAIPMVVFDDSNVHNQQKYYALSIALSRSSRTRSAVASS
ncbi:hypothetical protein ACSRUE_21135 [Sorangium sp. KYC3313]|uniref:hypothetical protein n=1 Tax=Sorangium sp. KYC3313 TaxID=3449740 RepID=UPI003F8AE94A